MHLSLAAPTSTSRAEEECTSFADLATHLACFQLHGNGRLHAQWRIPVSSRILVHEFIPAHWYWLIPGPKSATTHCEPGAGSSACFGRAFQTSATDEAGSG